LIKITNPTTHTVVRRCMGDHASQRTGMHDRAFVHRQPCSSGDTGARSCTLHYCWTCNKIMHSSMLLNFASLNFRGFVGPLFFLDIRSQNLPFIKSVKFLAFLVKTTKRQEIPLCKRSIGIRKEVQPFSYQDKIIRCTRKGHKGI